ERIDVPDHVRVLGFLAEIEEEAVRTVIGGLDQALKRVVSGQSDAEVENSPSASSRIEGVGVLRDGVVGQDERRAQGGGGGGQKESRDNGNTLQERAGLSAAHDELMRPLGEIENFGNKLVACGVPAAAPAYEARLEPDGGRIDIPDRSRG